MVRNASTAVFAFGKLAVIGFYCFHFPTERCAVDPVNEINDARALLRKTIRKLLLFSNWITLKL